MYIVSSYTQAPRKERQIILYQQQNISLGGGGRDFKIVGGLFNIRGGGGGGEGLELAIESQPKWNLNPQLLNSVQTFQPTQLLGHEFNSHLEPTLYSYSNFISFFSVGVSFWPLPSSVATFALGKISYKYSHQQWND